MLISILCLYRVYFVLYKTVGDKTQWFFFFFTVILLNLIESFSWSDFSNIKPPQKYKIQKSLLWHKGPTWSGPHLLPPSPCSIGFGHSSLLFLGYVKQSLCSYCSFCLGILFLQSPAQFNPISFFNVPLLNISSQRRLPWLYPSILYSHNLLYFSLQHLLPFHIILYIFICLFIFHLLSKERTLSYPLPYYSTD